MSNDSVMLAGLFLLAALPVAAEFVVPAVYQAVLTRHALDPDGLKSRGFVLREARCYRADARGEAAGQVVTPDELELLLSGSGQAGRAIRRREPALAALGAQLDASRIPAAAIFDGAAGAQGAAVAAPDSVAATLASARVDGD